MQVDPKTEPQFENTPELQPIPRFSCGADPKSSSTALFLETCTGFLEGFGKPLPAPRTLRRSSAQVRALQSFQGSGIGFAAGRSNQPTGLIQTFQSGLCHRAFLITYLWYRSRHLIPFNVLPNWGSGGQSSSPGSLRPNQRANSRLPASCKQQRVASNLS